MKWVFARVDKIGDLVLTLPVDQFPEAKFFQISWLTSTLVDPVMKNTNPQRKHLALDLNHPIQSFLKAYQFLKATKPIGLVVFQAPWWVAAAGFFARVPNRFGRLSQWYSFIFFNKGLRQKRSLSEKSEFEYNLDLVRLAFQNEIDGNRLFLQLNPKDSPETLSRFQISAQNYIVLHPGMAGSAENWPSDKYIQFGKAILEKNIPLVITGTSGDEKYLAPLRSELQKAIWTDGRLNFDELLYILKNAKAVVAPSTGVLHLAASLGVNTVGLYSSQQAHSATRWGARGPKVTLLSPESKSMNSISVERVFHVIFS